MFSLPVYGSSSDPLKALCASPPGHAPKPYLAESGLNLVNAQRYARSAQSNIHKPLGQ